MLSELTNHLWQSSVFTLLAGLMALAFRKNRAWVRHGLWLSASCKFLVPLSLLMSLGSRFEWTPVTQKLAAATAVQLTIVQISQPFPNVLAPPPAARAAHDWAGLVMFGAWACGFATVLLLRSFGWRRIRAVLRSSTSLEISAPIDVRSSAALLEPGVVGLLHPVLLLPAGISERLRPREFEAVLAHELSHVLRRDNLTSAIHMIVEAVFWFYPLVWWIGARLVQERERACDEAVLSLGNQPRDYAEGILKICKSYVELPVSCVSGVMGSDIKKRIQAILIGGAGRELTLGKKIALAIAALSAVMAPVAIGVMRIPYVQAESQQPTQSFREASVKSCAAFRKGLSRDFSSGTFRSECTTLQHLVEQAYGLFANAQMNPGSSLAVTGGPDWTASELFEIDARAEGSPSRSMMNGPMLQSLLEDRFNLKVHREIRKMSVYALILAEGGPKLRPFEGTCVVRDFDKPPSDADCGTASGYGNGMHFKAETMADLCAGFSVLLDRPVVDRTGLSGRFDFYVDLSAEDPSLLNRPRTLPALSDPTAPSQSPILFSAAEAAMNKLGLKLEPAEAPGQFLVIDRAEKPSGH